MPVTLPECAGIDRYPFESCDTCPTFRGCLIGDGDRLSPFVPEQFCCRIAWWNCHYGNDGGYYTRWECTIDDPIMRTYYTLSEEPMYRVVNPRAVFYGHIFPGSPVVINGEPRVWDNNSTGRSYPAVDCELLP